MAFFFIWKYEMTLQRKFIYVLLGLQFIGILLSFLFSNTISADNIEHLRMSFLVSEGYVPYRDFFEHHHPLLWYIFAPLMEILPQNAIPAFYISRILSLIASGFTFYIIYRIFSDFLGGKKYFIYFLITVFSFYPLWYGVCIFKPDTFMRLFYFGGIYLFFCYIKGEKKRDLLCCGLCFTIAFFFLQTAAFGIIPLMIPLIYIIYKNPQKLKQLIVAAIPSALLIAAAVVALILSNSWQSYFNLNWIYNAKLFDIIFTGKNSAIWNFLPLFIATAAVFICLSRKNGDNIYLFIIGLLFATEFIRNCYFLAAYPHYLINLIIFSSIIIALYLPQISNKSIVNYLHAFYLVFFAMNIITVAVHYIGNTWHKLEFFNNHPEAHIFHYSYFADQLYVPLRQYHTLGIDTLNAYNIIFNRPFDLEAYLSENNIKYIDFELSAEDEHEAAVQVILRRYRPIGYDILERYD